MDITRRRKDKFVDVEVTKATTMKDVKLEVGLVLDVLMIDLCTTWDQSDLSASMVRISRGGFGGYNRCIGYPTR